MSRLIISSPDGKRGILELHKPVITIGRGNANDLVLNHSSVSRFHAVVKLNGNSIMIADRGSTNGVVLNGERISDEAALKNGDIAVLGRYELRLEHVDSKDLLVRKADIPSTLNQIIRGGVERTVLPEKIKLSDSALTDLVNKIKKAEHVSEDEKKHGEKDAQKLHDEHLKAIDEVLKAKEAEILQV